MGFGSTIGSMLSKLKGGGQASPWSWDSINKNAPPIQAGDPYRAAFGKQAPSREESMGLPAFGAQRAPQGEYNRQAHEGAWGVANQAPQGIGNPFEGQNFNLGGGAMPGLDDASRYGSGLMGIARKGYEAADQWTQSPQAQQMQQMALQGLLGGQQAPQGITPQQYTPGGPVGYAGQAPRPSRYQQQQYLGRYA